MLTKFLQESKENRDEFFRKKDTNNHSNMNVSLPPLRILLVGDAGVGKTCLLNRWSTGQSVWKSEPTTSHETREFDLHLNIGKLRIVITTDDSSLNDIDAVFIVFDVTRKETAEFAKQRFGEFSKTMLCYLLGNKHDIVNKEVFMNYREFIQISAKSNLSLFTPIERTIQKIYGSAAHFIELPLFTDMEKLAECQAKARILQGRVLHVEKMIAPLQQEREELLRAIKFKVPLDPKHAVIN